MKLKLKDFDEKYLLTLMRHAKTHIRKIANEGGGMLVFFLYISLIIFCQYFYVTHDKKHLTDTFHNLNLVLAQVN